MPIFPSFDVEVGAIKAVTDLIPDSGAMTSIAQEASLAPLALEATVGAIPTNPMLDTEDGSSFSAIPDMALDSTVAKDATVAKEASLAPLALEASVAAIPVNPILDTEDGSSFTAIPAPADMALDSTVAKDATVAKEASLAPLALEASVSAIPTNPMLDTEDGSSFTAIPALAGMALDATVAKEATLSPKITGVLVDSNDESNFTIDMTGFGPTSIVGTLTAIMTDNYLVSFAITFTSGVNVGETRNIEAFDFLTGDTSVSLPFSFVPGTTDTFILSATVDSVMGLANKFNADDIEASVGNAQTANLGSLWGILGDPTINSITSQIGTDGVADLNTQLGYGGGGSVAGDMATVVAFDGSQFTAIPDMALESSVQAFGGTQAQEASLAPLALEASSQSILGDIASLAGIVALEASLANLATDADMQTVVGATGTAGEGLTAIPDMALDSTVAKAAANDSADSSGTLSYVTPWNNEQTVVELDNATRKIICGVWLDLINVTQNGTIRCYYKIDGTNYREISSDAFVIATDSKGVYIDLNLGITEDFKVTYQAAASETENRSIPFSMVYEIKE